MCLSNEENVRMSVDFNIGSKGHLLIHFFLQVTLFKLNFNKFDLINSPSPVCLFNVTAHVQSEIRKMVAKQIVGAQLNKNEHCSTVTEPDTEDNVY